MLQQESQLDFSLNRILVIGDVMLDEYLNGDVARISPEAPVPVLHAKNEKSTLGGAANVALNLSHLGVQVQLIGFVGEDPSAQNLRELCQKQKVDAHLLSSTRPTIRKQRIVGGGQQIMRIDHELVRDNSDTEEEALQKLCQQKLSNCELVILSDYGKGLCTPTFCAWLSQYCRKEGIPLLVDPKGMDWNKYAGASMITPNFKEFCEVLHRSLPNEDQAVEKHAPHLLSQLGIDALLVTRSEKGMSLCTAKDTHHVHTEAREVFDVSGAGDTVLATLGAALAAQWPLEEAMRLANRAAGLVVAKRGTVAVDLDELRHACLGNSKGKLQELDTLLQLRKRYRKEGKRMVFTNGCFDIMHRGHLEYLRRSRELGDLLVIGLNTDASVQKLKGPERPINNESDRALMLCAMEFVDHVVLFGEDTPLELLSQLQPEILVKGADYAPEQVIGREYAEELVLMDFVQGYSTTRIVQKMRDN